MRERDGAGRALNARPRDHLGRPLPRGARGVERVDESITRTVEQALTEAQALLDAGRPFHAHEVLEGMWKSAGPDERALWKGLAQLAVGLTHHLRGNPAGARTLLTRGHDAVEPYAQAPPYGLDIVGIRAWARDVGAQDAGAPTRPFRLRAGTRP